MLGVVSALGSCALWEIVRREVLTFWYTPGKRPEGPRLG